MSYSGGDLCISASLGAFIASMLWVTILGTIEGCTPKEYDILIGNEFESFEEDVESHKKDGWKMHGETQLQVIAGPHGQTVILFQPMER